MAVLGIDIGTSGSRALVVGDDGRILASATAAHEPFTSPGPAWAEQDPREWWRAAVDAVRSVLGAGGISAKDIQCVGLSGQMHGAVLLDGEGESLRPSIICCDQRTAEECRWLEREIGPDRLLELTSNPALTNFTLTKLLWVRKHEPDVWRRVRHVLLPKDDVRYKLSGAFVIDVADVSGTLMLDVARRAWSREMLDAANISMDLLPEVFESPAVSAQVSTEAATITGLLAGTPIVAGAGDQAAGAVGMGITRPGTVSVIIGTSGVVFAATERPALDRKGRIHTFCHAIPGRWHVMGVTQAAGLSLRWLRDQWQFGAGDEAYRQMTEEASAVPPGSDGVLWAPYLMGERTPHADPDVRGASSAWRLVPRADTSCAPSSRAWRSVSVTASRSSKSSACRRPACASVAAVRSALWREIQATVYGQPVETVAAEEGAAYGAAPVAAAAAIIDEQYLQYRRIYPAISGVYRTP